MDSFFSHLIPFITEHWLLASALVLVLLLIVFEETRNKVGGVHRLSPQEAITLINRENAILLDVRDFNAYSNGHIVNAVNVPNDKLEADLGKITKYKDKPVIIVCGTGQISITAGTKLRKQGFEKIYNLAGGIQAWRNANFPLTKD